MYTYLVYKVCYICKYLKYVESAYVPVYSYKVIAINSNMYPDLQMCQSIWSWKVHEHFFH